MGTYLIWVDELSSPEGKLLSDPPLTLLDSVPRFFCEPDTFTNCGQRGNKPALIASFFCNC